MKTILKNITLVLALFIGGSVMAQHGMKKEGMKNHEAKVIQLKQTPGEFNKKELKLKAGQPYVFEISNSGVDHEVGFVVTPKGKRTKADHIQNAYVQKMIPNGEKSTSKEVVLEAGEYEYFCPLNPTPHYSIVVN